MAYRYAPAPVFYCNILLAAPTLPSRHDFWAQCPPTFLSLLCCITASLPAILRCPCLLLVPLLQPLDVPWVDFVIPRSQPLACFGLLHEFEHVHFSIFSKQDFEVSSVWRFTDLDVFGFQLLYHSLSLSAPLPAHE